VKYGTIMVTVVGTTIDQSSVLIATICLISAIHGGPAPNVISGNRAAAKTL